MIYFQDPRSVLYQGDSRVTLRCLEPESVDCVVTSPPYWSLRSYSGIEPLLFGGDEDCEHECRKDSQSPLNGYNWASADWSTGGKPRQKESTVIQQSTTCTLCGCWRGNYGLEPTPQMYIDHSMEYLDAIWRVLKKSGTVFWNLGDSYAGSGGAHNNEHDKNPGLSRSAQRDGVAYPHTNNKGKGTTLKPKDMALIPFRFAIAAQERGWWVRSVIIWSKNNPMPESVTDRPTDSHEYIFLLTKSARYYWNQDAIREPHLPSSLERYEYGLHTTAPTDGFVAAGSKTGVFDSARMGDFINPLGRNARSVWTFPTHGYAEAHFATFPEELPRRCIAAGCPEDGTVLDPFAGAGTTLHVARKMGRKSIGVELSPEYCELIVDRIRQMVLL